MENSKEYYAFISYQRKDETWAKWLSHKLEHYRLPSTLNGRNLPKNLRPVFRDLDELSSGNLPRQIQQALKNSKNLVVVCSPNSAQSIWVNKEIEEFIAMGRTSRIYPFIVDGIAYSDHPDQECFPPALRNLCKEEERLGADINSTGREPAVVKTIAGMLGIGFDSLWQRREKEKKRIRLYWVLASLLLALLGFSVGAYFIRQNRIIRNQNHQLELTESRLREDSIQLSRNFMRIQNDSITLTIQKDSLIRTNELLEIMNTSLEKANMDLSEAYRRIAEEKDIALATQSRFVSEKATTLINTGHVDLASQLLLEVLPTDISSPNRPCVPEAEAALRLARSNDNAMFMTDEYGYSNMKQVSISPDGKTVLLLRYGDMEIWDVSSRTLLKTIEGGTHDVSIFSPNGKNILSYDDNEICIYDVETGKNILHIEEDFTNTIMSPERLSSGITSVSYSHDGKHLVSSHRNGAVKIWNAETGTLIHTLNEHLGAVQQSVFSPNGKYIASGGDDCFVIIWDAHSYEPVCYHPFTTGIISVDFSADSNRLLLVKRDGVAEVMEALSGNFIQEFKEGVICAKFNHHSNKLVTTSIDKSIKVWDDKTELYCYKGNEAIVYASFNPSDDKLVSLDHSGKVQLWNISGDESKILPVMANNTNSNFISHVSFHPNGKKVLVSSSSGLMEIDIKTNKTKTYYDNLNDFCQYTPDGKLAVAVQYNGIIGVWDLQSGSQITTIKPEKENELEKPKFCISPNSKHLVTVSRKDLVCMWNVEDGRMISHREFDDKVSSAGFDKMGNVLILTNNMILFLDKHTLKTIRKWTLNDIKPEKMVVSSDGKYLYLIGQHTKIYDLDGKKPPMEWTHPDLGLCELTTSPDGRYVVTSSGLDAHRGLIRVWDRETMLEVFKSPIQHGYINSACLSPNGNLIVSGSSVGDVKIWDFPNLQLLINEERGKKYDVPLSDEERKKYYLK